MQIFNSFVAKKTIRDH